MHESNTNDQQNEIYSFEPLPEDHLDGINCAMCMDHMFEWKEQHKIFCGAKNTSDKKL